MGVRQLETWGPCPEGTQSEPELCINKATSKWKLQLKYFNYVGLLT